jgi:ATP-binding cassette, subfamily B, bacterial
MGDEKVHRPGPPGARETRPVGSLRRLLPFVRPYRFRFAAALVVSTGVLTADVAQPEIIKRFVDEVLRGGMRERLFPYALTTLVLGAGGALFGFVRRNLAGSIALGLEYDLRNFVYAHLQRLAVAFHDDWQSGELVARAVTDIARIRRFVGFGLMWLFILLMAFVFTFTQLFRIDVGLALLCAVFCAPVVGVSYRFSKIYHEVSRTSQDQQGDLTTMVEESATGVRVIKAFGRMPQRSALFRGQTEKIFNTNLRGVRARSHLWSLDILFVGLSLVAIVLWGGMRVVSGSLTPGGLTAVFLYQGMLVWPVRELGWIIAMGQEAVASSERVHELLDTRPEIEDAPDASHLATSRGEIRFEDVSFLYPETDTWVLRGLDLAIHPDETLALVGMTGCGKTTVAMLVARFYDPTTGRVTLDTNDLRSVTVRSLRSHIGTAFEDPILFSASVRENVLMGRSDASDTDVWAALAIAQADEFVRELPWQLDTRVGEQGYSLSGGQRQRIALARAVIGRPRILVLDNPLSSVDVHTEAKIETALREILVGRTAILIAHRPSTLLLADRVALLHDGRVHATGSHHELLEREPLYRRVLAADVEEEREGVSV